MQKKTVSYARFGSHLLKLELYREYKHGPDARMTCKFVRVFHIFKTSIFEKEERTGEFTCKMRLGLGSDNDK